MQKTVASRRLSVAKRTIIVITLCISMSGCHTAAVTAPTHDIVNVSFRPGWFGAYFSVRIASDGAAEVRTREWASDHVREVRHSRRQLHSREVARLVKLVEEANLSALREHYEVPTTDLDEISISDPRTGRKVVIYGPNDFCDEPSLAGAFVLWNEVVKLSKPPRVPRRRSYTICSDAF